MSDNKGTQLLDGNALGALLADVFGTDVTAWTARCAGCARRGPVARLVVHMSAMGAVGRCPDCQHVVLRIARLGEQVGLDLRGAALVQAPAADAGEDLPSLTVGHNRAMTPDREPYDADLAAWVAARSTDPTAGDTSVEGSRAHSRATNALAAGLVADRINVSRERAIQIPTAAGPVRARAFYPPSGTPSAIVAYFHGGGWVIGDLDTHAQHAARLALACSAVVVSVGYRRAPEHRFPVAYDDSLAATLWLHRNLDEFLPDVAQPRLAVAGDSAGGQLAASVAIGCRDRSVPLAAQFLLYPVTDVEGRYASPTLNARYPSRDQNAEGFGLTLAGMTAFVDHYADGGFADARMSPMHADDLSGVAPAIVHTAGYDVLRDEGDAYAHRLVEHDVPVTHRHWPTLGHSFFGLGGVSPVAEQAATRASEDLAARLA